MQADHLSQGQLNLLAYVHLRNITGSTGAGRVARQLAEHLALRSDVNLHILADAADKDRVLPHIEQPWKDFRYHTFASDTSRQQALWFAFGRPAAETFWPEAQVVFCTAESYVPVRKARLAVTLHDAAYFESSAHRQDKSFRKQQLKWRFLFHRLSRTADMFHTVSQFSADRLAHFFPRIASRLCIVPNAVTPHFFLPVPEAGSRFLAEHGLQDRAFILIPGGLHYRKNADLILAAAPMLFRCFPDIVLAVVNHSDQAYADRALALHPGVRILGFVSDEALHALYSAATAVWFPSLYEGFGLPVIEAMACGAPVVASNASSIPEVAGTAALLVSPANPQAHIEALESLLTHPATHSACAHAGRERARHFTWEASAARLKHAFDALL